MSNLAATYYEVGDYRKSIEVGTSAWQKSEDNPERREKLAFRLARCHVLLREPDQAERWLSSSESPEATTLLNDIRAAKHDGTTAVAARMKIVDGLPRYRVAM